MKNYLLLVLLISSSLIFSQNECEYSSNFTDSLGTYKATKDYLMHERVFGGKNTSINFSLVNNDGLISLSVQTITSSNEFIKANCYNNRSKIYFQLANSKIVNLISVNEGDDCGTSIFKNGLNYRILTGNFLFIKDGYEELKKSPITLMRIVYNSETIDYIIKEELVSEIDSKTYQPEKYFINFLKCVE
jgi:hypothetical protein